MPYVKNKTFGLALLRIQRQPPPHGQWHAVTYLASSNQLADFKGFNETSEDPPGLPIPNGETAFRGSLPSPGTVQYGPVRRSRLGRAVSVNKARRHLGTEARSGQGMGPHKVRQRPFFRSLSAYLHGTYLNSILCASEPKCPCASSIFLVIRFTLAIIAHHASRADEPPARNLAYCFWISRVS